MNSKQMIVPTNPASIQNKNTYVAATASYLNMTEFNLYRICATFASLCAEYFAEQKKGGYNQL